MSQFPPPDYVAVESALDGIEVYAPAPEQPEATEEVVEFKCPRCRATTAYSVEDGGLRCAHCGYYEPPETEVVGKGAQEFEFTVDVVAAAREAHGWGTARTSLQCQNCGAETSLPPGRLTHTCPFCGSNRVVQQAAPQEALRPRFLIPFRIEDARCRQITREWLGASWMTPKALKETARVADFRPIYLPYWTFDARTDAPWRAQVGHTETERYYDHSSKSWKTRTKTVWRWESGRARRTFDDLLVAGTSRVSALLLSRVNDFDTGALAPYAPAYLAGLLAQAYDVQLETAWEVARDRMREETRQTCRSQASTSKIRNFSMALDFADESWRYVLLPVYVAVYRYEGESYQVLVNGQTGTIAGQRPVDWTKVWLAVGGMLAPGVLLGLLGLLATGLGVVITPSLIAGGGILILAFILLVIGIVFAVITITKARSLDDV